MFYEYTAVKVDFKKDNEEEIKNSKRKLLNFKQRDLTDDAIVYEGKCDLKDKCISKVHMVLDLDENKNIYLRQKTQEEIEKGKYEPSQELKDKLGIEGSVIDRISNILKIYEHNIENRKLFSEVYSKIKGLFSKIKKDNNKLLLEEGKEINSEKNYLETEDEPNFKENLASMTVQTPQMDNQSKEEQNYERDKEFDENEISI